MLNRPLIENEDYYIGADQKLVFTAKYLEDRGYCCGNGCRHCPYDYEAVPEPARSDLLQQQKTNQHGKDSRK